MPDERIVAQLVFEALDRASGELRKIAGSMEAVGDSAEEAGEQSDQAFTITGLTLTDVKSSLDMVLGSLRQAQQAMKQMVEFAELGAQAAQTEESFAFLRQEMGLTPGYLNTVKDAAGGTIPNLKLMAGVGTLVAGTSKEFGAELANSYPALIEYARAAAKLNPHLGDTSFMLDSIATGIKRGSPLILDNLGLVVKVGEANRIYAEQLGKSVDQLTAEEKQMALLNDTMRAGDRLIEQVGGKVDSATDKLAEMEAATENAKTEFALWWHEMVEGSGALEVATKNLVAATGKMRFARVIDEAKELGIVTEEEIRRYDRLAAARGSQERKLEVMAELEAELTQRIQEHNVAAGDNAAAIGTQEAATEELTVAMVAAAWAAEHGAETLEETTEAHRRFAKVQEDDRRQTYDWTEAVEAASAAEEARAEAAQRAAEVQAAAVAKVAEARRQAAADLGDEFTEALGDGDSAASEIEEVTARLEELYQATGRTVTVAASSEEEHIKAALAMYSAGDAATRLAEAQQRLAENTDPEQQRALEIAVLNAQLGLGRAQESATELNNALTEGGSYVTNYTGEIERLEAQLEKLQGEAMVEALYAAADAANASAPTLALLAAATGDYTDETIAAALRAAVLQEKIEEMGVAVANGDISIGTAIENIKAFAEAMDALPDETVVVDVEVAVKNVESAMAAAKAKAAHYLAKHQAGDPDLTITPEADTSVADAALETTSGKVGTLTEAVGTATTDVEGLKEAMEEIPTELTMTITSNVPSQLQMLRQMKNLIETMPSMSSRHRDDYDDDPTSLH